MVKYLVLASSIVCGLGLGVSHAQGYTPDPAKLLARAVSLVKKCGHTTSSVELDDNDRDKGKLKESPEDNTTVDQLSLKILLRAGRYHLEPEVANDMVDGFPVWVVGFKPLPEKLQLKPWPGEKGYYATVMNDMAGVVDIDPVTGGIVRVQADMVSKHSFYLIFHVDRVSVDITQKLYEETWVPLQADLKVKGGFGIGHDRYVATFTCAAK